MKQIRLFYRSHALRGNAVSDAPASASLIAKLCVGALLQNDAKRLGLHSHAERGNDKLLSGNVK